MGNLFKLKTCKNNFEAQVLKGALMTEGIMCLLSNDAISNVYGGLIPEFTQVDIMVPEQDFDAAKQIVDRSNVDSESILADESMQNLEWSFG